MVSLCAISSDISETIEDLFLPFGIDVYLRVLLCKRIFIWLECSEGPKTGKNSVFKTLT